MKRWLYRIWGYAIGIGILALCALAIIGDDIQHKTHVAYCRAGGGHYVSQPFAADECWSGDGHRIFPEGF